MTNQQAFFLQARALSRVGGTAEASRRDDGHLPHPVAGGDDGRTCRSPPSAGDRQRLWSPHVERDGKAAVRRSAERYLRAIQGVVADGQKGLPS